MNALSNHIDTEISEWKMEETHILALPVTLNVCKSVLVSPSEVNKLLFRVCLLSALRWLQCLHLLSH